MYIYINNNSNTDRWCIKCSSGDFQAVKVVRGFGEVMKRSGSLLKIAGRLPEKEKISVINVLFYGVNSLLYLRNTTA